MINKKKIGGLIAGALALTLVVGTWAFYSSEANIDNKLETGEYGWEVVEPFTPPPKWEPGTEVEKAIGATNTGDCDIVIRITMDEKWSRNGTAFKTLDPKVAAQRTAFNSVAKSGSAGSYIYTATQVNDKDGIVPTTTNEQSVVYKNLEGVTNGTWIDGQDGYWYYKNILKPGQQTGYLLNGIAQASNIDIGVYENSGVMYSTVPKDNTALVNAQAAYDAAAAAYNANPTDANKAAMDSAYATLDAAYKWSATPPADETQITFKKNSNSLNANLKGYADADYVLAITTQAAQATPEAVQAEWGTIPAAVKTAWGW